LPRGCDGAQGADAPQTSISLLGPLRIHLTVQDIKRAPTRELIAYLALHPRGASRDELTDALWPQLDTEAARKRLWQSATDARRALGDAWVRNGKRYELDRARLHIDLDQLDHLLAHIDADSEPQTLIALWRGKPLEKAPTSLGPTGTYVA
jgi:DNA-binding SARP family transcriptional activator